MDAYRGVLITCAHQREQLGLAQALLQVESYIDEDVLSMLGDNCFRRNLGDIVERQTQDDVDAAFLVETVPLSEAGR